MGNDKSIRVDVAHNPDGKGAMDAGWDPHESPQFYTFARDRYDTLGAENHIRQHQRDLGNRVIDIAVSTEDHQTVTYEVQVEPRAARVNVGPGGNLDLDNLFTYHPPTPDQIPKYERLREGGRELASLIGDLCPPGPDRSTAIRKVREAVMWANASIACDTKSADSDAPHSRACGITPHPHGTACHPNCPTCHGKRVES